MERLQGVHQDIGGDQGFDSFGGVRETVPSRLPDKGRKWSDLREELLSRKGADYDWRSGRLSLYVYHEDEELLAVARDAYEVFFTENALGQRAFPSLASLEGEVIRMSLDLFHAPEGAGGSFTSGGTESIFLALKSARDRFREHRGHATAKVILPRTAHPAFDKAAQYLGVDTVRVAVGDDLRVDIREVERSIDDRTMMIVGSAPCYPYGVFDRIDLLSELASEYRLWLHVDACLGGFLAPFAQQEGYPIPNFDFVLPGVSTLSADLHKYGFSARGASVLLHRSASTKVYQRFEFSDWPRGTYATETFLGSRPGGAIASAWSVMQFLGRSGYRRLARKTMEAKRQLISGINAIAGLRVITPSELSIFLYRSTDEKVDIHAVADAMAEKKWFVGRSREPAAVHFAVNAVHAPIVDEYLRDLTQAVEQVRASGRTGVRDDMTY